MIMNNWGLSPVNRGMAVCGLVTGSDKFNDGTEIITSSIVEIKHDKESDVLSVITNSGSEYILGEVDPVYEEMFPNARNRTIAMQGTK